MTRKRNSRAAAAELADAAANPDAAIALLFASSTYDLDALTAAVSEAMAPTPVYGCSSAEEISGAGFTSDAAVIMTVAGDGVRVGVGLGTHVSSSSVSAGRRASLLATAALGLTDSDLDPARHVGLCLVDGRSGHEAGFIAGAAGSSPTVQFVGGAASDQLTGPPAVRVFFDGEAHTDAGLIALFETPYPYAVIKSEHMRPTDRRVVVTQTDESGRLVLELNGRPAVDVFVEEYGIDDPSDIRQTAVRPFAYVVGGSAFVRSVQHTEGDALRFACTVERGTVLRTTTPGDLLETTRGALARADEELGGVAALIAFNCAGRYFESQVRGTTEELGSAFANYPVVGFNSFGELIGPMHVNHTLTALAFGGERG